MESWKVTVTENGKIADLFIEAVNEAEARVIAEANYPNALIIEVQAFGEDGSLKSIL